MPFRFVALLMATAALLLGAGFPAAAGELREADRTLLAKVKEGLLWEGPASRLAAERAGGKRVRDVGARIADDQARLDVSLRAVADRLAVELPVTPTGQEQSWADEITASSGAQFDRIYVNRVRAAYGSVFGLASEVRAGTQDDDVRAFAQAAVDTALQHMTLLESTGLAETTSLVVSAAEDNSIGGGDIALGAVLVGFATVATFGLVRLLGSPGKK